MQALHWLQSPTARVFFFAFECHIGETGCIGVCWLKALGKKWERWWGYDEENTIIVFRFWSREFAVFPRGEEEPERCCCKYHCLFWAGLKTVSPKVVSSPLLFAVRGWLTAAMLFAFLPCRALRSWLFLSLCKTLAQRVSVVNTLYLLVLLHSGLWAR